MLMLILKVFIIDESEFSFYNSNMYNILIYKIDFKKI